MPQLEQERENLRLALAWCAEHEDVERGLRLIARSTEMWRQAGPRSEGLAWLRRFLERAPAALPTWLRLQTLHSATLLAAGIGDLPAMGAYLAQALELAEAGPDRRVLVRVLTLSAQGLLRVGDLPAARAASERLRALVRESPIGQEDEVGAWVALGMAAHVGGDPAGAAAAYQAALAVPGWARHPSGGAGDPRALRHLGYLALDAGRPEEAARCFRAILTMLERAAHQADLLELLCAFAGLARAQGAWAAAARLLGASDVGLERLGGVLGEPIGRAQRERTLAAARERLGEPAFAAAYAGGRALSLGEAVAEALDESAQR